MGTETVNARVSGNDPVRSGIFVVPDIVLEHFEELVFLSIQRRKLLFGPDATRRQFGLHLDRTQAHWDGLVVAGAHAVDLITDALDGGDPWEVCLAAQGWLRLASPTAQQVVAKIGESDPENRSGWLEGLRHAEARRIEEVLPPDGVPDDVLALAVDVWLWHGLLGADSVADLATHPDAMVRAAVARQLAWAPTGGSSLSALLDEDDPHIWRPALFGTALLDSARALRHARTRLVRDADPFAARLIGLFGEASDIGTLRDAMQNEGSSLAALYALGDLGQTEAIDALIEQLDGDDDQHREAAAASIRTIVGELPQPQLEPGSEEPPETPAQQAERAWQTHGARYPSGVRWLRGQHLPFDGEASQEPMESAWRSAIAAGGATADHWLRKEVPDGFFSGFPNEEALPGE